MIINNKFLNSNNTRDKSGFSFQKLKFSKTYKKKKILNRQKLFEQTMVTKYAGNFFYKQLRQEENLSNTKMQNRAITSFEIETFI